jgi:hypothetical protein
MAYFRRVPLTRAAASGGGLNLVQRILGLLTAR